MKIAFVGHGYHKVTASSRWFIDLLAQRGEVEEFWDHRWRGGKDVEVKSLLDFDRIYVWQISDIARQVAQCASDRMVFIPMWDAVCTLDDEFWTAFGRTRILSFSWALHERVRRLCLNSYQTQYFPDPAKFDPVTDFSDLRGFLWQRRADVGWREVSNLSRGSRWSRFNLHAGMDPGFGDLELPAPAEIRRNNIVITRFAENPTNAESDAKTANIVFAPRAIEGIGMAYLEGMARGQCVVSPDAPTMSEYIENRVTGLLYDQEKVSTLDFSQAERIGKAARRRIERGFEEWSYDLNERLPDILFPDRSGIAPPRTRAQAEWRRTPIPRTRLVQEKPSVTVAIVTLNAADTFDETLRSALEQTYDDIEIVVIDGASKDGTLDMIEASRAHIDVFVSEPDNGPYDAMNKAARLASGKFILYMNAGDQFASRTDVEKAFEAAPENADFIFGHHIYVSGGIEHFHRARDFDDTFRELKNGALSWRWLSGVPCHQATFARRELLIEEGGYSSRFKIAADHEFMYRMRAKGCRFHHCGETLAIYTGGGFSAQRQLQCTQEWWRIARLYGERRGVDAFFRPNLPRTHELDLWRLSPIRHHVIMARNRLKRRGRRQGLELPA